MAEKLQFNTYPKDLNLAESFDVYMCNEFSVPSFAIRFLKEHADSFKARDDDIYVISYPKTGTTWLQEIVYIIHSNLNFDEAKSKGLYMRFPYVEHASTDIGNVINMPSPRLLKSHLPYSLLPKDIHNKKCKMLYITRNPKDVVVSYYNFACWLNETRYQGTFSQFFERFIANRTTYSPFLLHNLEFWNHRNDENILFLFYEDLQKDLAENIKKISQFLGKSLTSEEIKAIVEFCSFKSMKNQETFSSETSGVIADKFFRKGKVGDWKNYFNDEMNVKMEKWIKDTLKDSNLTYTYEI